ncbi:MAG: hypothetical protein A4E35_00617 [Methanoregula sp. PtaU1.Bin051]|nr:MAG: hypothetical protein A4E35_00617 [Methanoregula sp. PtaU1.Bin051]
MGLRRTGKTTLMRQLMERLESPAAFFSFDEEETRTKEVLVFVLDYVITTLNAKSILLDEIQYVEGWEGVLKRYYDQKGFKFILSGSESLDLSRAKAALAGRIATFSLPPLSFGEYLRLKGVTIGNGPASLSDYPAMKRLYEECLTRKEYFEHEFVEYLWKGAFPEIVSENDSAVVRRYISDLVVRKIVYQDIPSIFEVRRPDILFGRFRYTSACSSSHKPYLPARPRSARGALSARPLHRNTGQLLLHLQDKTLALLAPDHDGAVLRSCRHGPVHPRHQLRAGEEGCDHR